MAAMTESQAANPNRFAHAEAVARKRASSSEKRGSDTSILKKIIGGEGTRSRGNSVSSEPDGAARARSNWKAAGTKVRAMLRFRSGGDKSEDDRASIATQESDIPDRFAHGVAVAKRTSIDQQMKAKGKQSVIKRMNSS